MLTVATVNVNGIRAAVRRGMPAWLAQRTPDVLCLQEVRADDATLGALLDDALGPGWHVAHAEPTDAGTRGRAGVAVATRLPVAGQRTTLDARFDGAGRWVELDVELDVEVGPGVGAGVGAGAQTVLDAVPDTVTETVPDTVTVASVYVHSGQAGTPQQETKHAFLDAVTDRMAALGSAGRTALVCGDLNVAHTAADLRNWRGNTARAGFLPRERAQLDRWFDELGWVDVVRALHPGVEGPYSWWSWRGQAFDRDTGWRIDLQVATPDLAARAVEATVDRAPSYAERFSDHAPVVVRYDPPRPARPPDPPSRRPADPRPRG